MLLYHGVRLESVEYLPSDECIEEDEQKKRAVQREGLDLLK